MLLVFLIIDAMEGFMQGVSLLVEGSHAVRPLWGTRFIRINTNNAKRERRCAPLGFIAVNQYIGIP